MALAFIRKMFDTSERDVKSLLPIVSKVNALEETMQALADGAFADKTAGFRQRFAEGETLDDLLPEAFALCREAGRRKIAMRHFDTQVIGGAVLHQGRIAEMKTGEGKTLVATLPLYLNAISGEGAHLVTVNDYLARRDAVWMSPIYHMLGLSVGIIQGQSQDTDELGGSYLYEPGCDDAGDPRYMHCKPCTRKEAYLADITYGTNHEFGFDYLRDNMAYDMAELSQRTLNYAIVDEVDSILIDEARTPHIISGAVDEDVSQYVTVNRAVRTLVNERDYKIDEKARSASLTEEGNTRMEKALNVGNLTEDPETMHYVSACLKAHAVFHRDKEYVVKDGEIVIVDEFTGRLMFGRRYSDGLHQAIEAKEGVPIRKENQTIAVVTFQNLFRLYSKLAGMTGTAKTEEDEFRKIYGLDVVTIPTNKEMVRKDYADVVFKTEEAKFRGIAWEVMRLYAKQQPVLVGTRSIQISEKISKRLTFDKLQILVASRKLLEHMEKTKSIAKDKKAELRRYVMQKINDVKPAQIQQIARELGINLKMTDQENIEWVRAQFNLGPDADEFIEESLKHGIPHNILNAKYHEKEALIIAEAGVKGRVTIATNMAGRGVDILLGGTILPEDLKVQRQEEDAAESPDEEQEEEATNEESPLAAETYVSFRRGGKQRAAPPLPLDQQQRSAAADEIRKLSGLYILGTERHESRRIDNQLRGRSGRQGDPGESQFFVSMEDELMRLFGEKTTNNPLLRQWPEDEPIQAKFLSTMIEKAQKRIEYHNFETRKHVLQYDDVLNVQRDIIYAQRREVLAGQKDMDELILTFVVEYIEEKVGLYTTSDGLVSEWDFDGLFTSLHEAFSLGLVAQISDLQPFARQDHLTEFLVEKAKEVYTTRRGEIGEEMLHHFERWFVLRATNNKWMEHLAMMDHLREGIGLRGYAQRDPLVEYKREAFDIFEDTMRNIRDEVILWTFHFQVERQRPRRQMVRVAENSAVDSQPVQGLEHAAGNGRPGSDFGPVDAKVGRNDPCPCGSGLKYKKCHGQ